MDSIRPITRQELERMGDRYGLTLSEQDLALLIPFYEHSRGAILRLVEQLDQAEEPANLAARRTDTLHDESG